MVLSPKKAVIGTLAVTLILAACTVAGVVYSGFVSVAADTPHSAAVHSLLETARNRSIAVRADNIDVVDLDSAAMLRAGAGNYDAMCASCHLVPGQTSTELSLGLYPTPPDLTHPGASEDPARTFWIIKHGIKSTGMPAWGTSMDDPYIWELVAFVQELPSMSASQYQSLVESSGGHQHGGGESPQHEGHHDSEAATGHHEERSGEIEAVPSAPTKATTHIHPDGKKHLHQN